MLDLIKQRPWLLVAIAVPVAVVAGVTTYYCLHRVCEHRETLRVLENNIR